jgi:hypothetical protein
VRTVTQTASIRRLTVWSVLTRGLNPSLLAEVLPITNRFRPFRKLKASNLSIVLPISLVLAANSLSSCRACRAECLNISLTSLYHVELVTYENSFPLTLQAEALCRKAWKALLHAIRLSARLEPSYVSLRLPRVCTF